MSRRLPSRRRLIRAIRITACIMGAISKTTLPLRRDMREMLEQQAVWLREQLKAK